MAYSIYDATAPLCAQQLTALLGICDKAAAYCADKKVDEAWLLTDRLAPDMFSLGRQIRQACDFGRNTVGRLAGVAGPDFPAVDAALHGLSYDNFWVLGIGACGLPGRKFFNELLKGSWKAGDVSDSYVVPTGEYLGGEPVCVMNPADPNEAVVIVIHSLPAEGRAEYLIFDGHALSNGPIARLPLRHPIHAGFHTSFHFE